MRRKTTAWMAAGALGAGLTASIVGAQQATRSSDAVSTYGASAARTGRSLLRNGLDYLKYQQYERALKFLRQAEAHSDGLNASEKTRLRQGIDAAQKGLRAAADPNDMPYALSERSRPRQGFAVASPPTALADRSAPIAPSVPTRAAHPLDPNSPAFGIRPPLADDGPGEPIQLAGSAPSSTGASTADNAIADNAIADAVNGPSSSAAATDVHLQRARAPEGTFTQPREIPSMDPPPLSTFSDGPAARDAAKPASTPAAEAQPAPPEIAAPDTASAPISLEVLPADATANGPASGPAPSSPMAPPVMEPAVPVVEPPPPPPTVSSFPVTEPAEPVVEPSAPASARLSGAPVMEPAVPVVDPSAPASAISSATATNEAPAPIALEVVPPDASSANGPAQEAASPASAPALEPEPGPAVPTLEPASAPDPASGPAASPISGPAAEPTTEMAQPSPVLERPAPVSPPPPLTDRTDGPSNVVPATGDQPAAAQALETAPAAAPEPAPALETALALDTAPNAAPEAASNAAPEAPEEALPAPTSDIELPPLPSDLGRAEAPATNAPTAPPSASAMDAPIEAPADADPGRSAPLDTLDDAAAPPAMPEGPGSIELPPLPSDLGRAANEGPEANSPVVPAAASVDPALNGSANASDGAVPAEEAPVIANANTGGEEIQLPPLPVEMNAPAPAQEALVAQENAPAPAPAPEVAVAPASAPEVAAVPTPAPASVPASAPEVAAVATPDPGTSVDDEPVIEEAPPALGSDTSSPDTGAPPTAAAVASAPLSATDETGSVVPPRLSRPSLLTNDQLRHIEQVARAQEREDVARREAIAQGRAPQSNLPVRDTNPSNLQTQLDLSRAPSPAQARPIRAIPVPDDWVPLAPRRWSPQRKMWAAAATCHLPLYFQDPMLERYGHPVEQFFGPIGRFISYPVDDPRQSTQRNYIAQAAFSVGLFASQVAVLPYNLIMDPPWEAQYDLGYYRPGDVVPTDTYWLPLHGYGPPLRGDRY